MPQEPNWNWKAVVAGALSNPLFVVGSGAGVLLKLITSFGSQVPADEVEMSDEERKQKRAERLQEVKDKHEAAKDDPKTQRFNKLFRIGRNIAWCASYALQGNVAGRVAKKHPLAHAAASYGVTFVVRETMRRGWSRSEFFQGSGLLDQKQPLKNRLLFRALEVCCVLLGSYLSRRK